MAELQYLDQDPSSLRLSVFAEAINPAPLHVLATDELELSGWWVKLHVLATSHLLIVGRDGACLAELLSCSPESPGTPLHGWQDVSTGLHAHIQSGQLLYDSISKPLQNAPRKGLEGALVADYPKGPDKRASAWTRLRVTTHSEAAITLESVHWYGRAKGGVETLTAVSHASCPAP